jgi:hypothetical protein
MCLSCLAIAVITSPNAVKLLFIAYVSFSLSPSTLDYLIFSDPAKSMKFKDPFIYVLDFSWYPLIFNYIMQWLLEECSFKHVSKTIRLLLA